MIKRVFVFLTSLAIVVSMTGCYMPQNIFADDGQTSSQDDSRGTVESIYGFNFTMDSKSYSLPSSFDEFAKNGWGFDAPDNDADDEDDDAQQAADDAGDTDVAVQLDPDTYSDYVDVYNDQYHIQLKFYNASNDTADFDKCFVVGIKMDALGDSVPFTQLAEEMKFSSKYSEIVKNYGLPSFEKEVLNDTGAIASVGDVEFDTSEGEKSKVACYKVNEHTFAEFTFGTIEGNDDSLIKLVMENDTEPADDDYDYSKDREKAPDVIALYKAPDLLGKTLNEFSFKYNDNLYTLPIPVAELVDDGWDFAKGAEIKVPRGSTVDGVVLQKDNTFISLMVHNYDTKKVQTPINCYAVSLSAGITGPYTNIMLPKGVSLGTDVSEVIEVYGGVPDADTVDDDTVDADTVDDDTSLDTPNDREYVNVFETEEYTVYSYVMKDDVPSVQIPVSISDIGDAGRALLGAHRKHIDIYVSNVNQKVVYVYMQNCPEFIVDEAAIWAKQLENANQN